MNIPILVVSCDAYQDVWHPFFHCFFKNWTDCPFPVYLVSNTLHYSHPRVSPLLVGLDIDYSSNLIKALTQITGEWVIFWIEDRPPAVPVDTANLVKLIQLAQSRNAGYLRLIPFGTPALVEQNEMIGEIPKGTRYRISMTVALWKKSTLLKILTPGESAWDIEKRGGVQRSNHLDEKFYALPINICSLAPIQDIHLVFKGKLTRKGRKFLSNEKLIHYMEKRPIISSWQNLEIEFKILVWKTYYNVYWYIKKIQITKNMSLDIKHKS